MTRLKVTELKKENNFSNLNLRARIFWGKLYQKYLRLILGTLCIYI